MPEYLSPGVYVEEISTGPRPIEGVSTSTAGFVGLTERGPTAPRLVTSWGDYQRWFGDTLDPAVSFLPLSVKGFFDNGGQRAFIARVVGAGATAATRDFPTANANSVLRMTTIGAGAWGSRLLVRIQNASLNAPAWFRLTLLYYATGIPNPFVDPLVPRNLSDPSRREPDVIEDYDNLTATAGRPNFIESIVNPASKLVQVSFANPGGGAVVNARPNDLGMDAGLAFTDLATANPNTALRLTARAAGANGNQITATVAAGTNANTFRVTIDDNAGNAENFDNLPDNDPIQVIGALETSTLVRGRWFASNPPNPATPARPANAAATNLAGGGDGSRLVAGGQDGNAVTPTEFFGSGAVPPDRRTGLAGLETIDEVNLLIAPDEVNGNINNSDQITNAVIDQCERLRDRFAILSIARNSGDVQNIRPPRDSSFGAVYYPWIRVFDARTQEMPLIPSVGHVAGIYARTDVDRGVHKAPANEVVRGILTRDIGPNVKPLEYQIVKQEHDILNPRGVNVIRDFRSDRRGIRVWGARTMSSDPQWNYVNVRRLFLFVEESIDEGTQWVVFEPNDEPTWSAVRRSISNFLVRVWRSGALMGATEEEAFFVKCDRTTMTQDDIDNGRLICLIGIAPVKPAEFVIFRISQKTADAPQ